MRESHDNQGLRQVVRSGIKVMQRHREQRSPRFIDGGEEFMPDSITLSYRVPDDILRMARSTAGLWFEENSRRLEDGLLVEFPGGWFSDRSRREQAISFTANIPGLTDALQDELRKFGSHTATSTRSA